MPAALRCRKWTGGFGARCKPGQVQCLQPPHPCPKCGSRTMRTTLQCLHSGCWHGYALGGAQPQRRVQPQQQHSRLQGTGATAEAIAEMGNQHRIA
jgi:hypothetical protein